MTETATAAIAQAAADADAALAKLQDAVGRIGDGDLARSHRGGGWSVAQVISHINVSNLVWVANLQRLVVDPGLDFFFREEVGHDALGYPPPTTEVAGRQLAATRTTLATTVPSAPPATLSRTVTIPDLGTMTVAEWTPLIIGHVVGHVEQAFEIMRDREFAPEGV
jgi:uncharacterized damage-inducible protein DinB